MLRLPQAIKASGSSVGIGSLSRFEAISFIGLGPTLREPRNAASKRARASFLLKVSLFVFRAMLFLACNRGLVCQLHSLRPVPSPVRLVEIAAYRYLCLIAICSNLR